MLIRHGELMLVPVKELPADAQNVKTADEIIVAHSESGHHHVMVAERGSSVSEFMAGAKRFVAVNPNTKIVHRKTGPAAHRTLDVPAGVYELRAKTEFNYTRKLREKVRD